MPPKANFTKEDIINAALDIVKAESFENLTARALGKKLGRSTSPIFTLFNDMEEIKEHVTRAIKNVYKGYVEKGLAEVPAFKGVGMQYIIFAMSEPKLFQILFMNEQSGQPDIDNVLPIIDESYDKILSSITNAYGIDKPNAERIYRHLWIYTHGIASLCATKMCSFSISEISEMLTEVFIGLLKQIKAQKETNYD